MSMRISPFLGILASLVCSFAFAQQPLSDGPGLYADGFNTAPPDHFSAGLAASARVRPLDRDGRPAGIGKIAMVSIGMSNTTQEFCAAQNPAPCASWSFVGQALLDPALPMRSYRVSARGFCTVPARAVDGDGAVLLTRFDFAGLVIFSESDGASPDAAAVAP